MLLNPVEQSLRMFRYWVQYFVCCNINCNVGSLSGSHLKVLISGNLVGDFPVKRLAVSSKILLIFLTFPLTVKMQRFQHVSLRHTQLREPESYFQRLFCNTDYHKNMIGDPSLSTPQVASSYRLNPHSHSPFPAIQPILLTHTVITIILTKNSSTPKTASEVQ